MRKKSKKIISSILGLVVLFQMVCPVSSYAVENGGQETTNESLVMDENTGKDEDNSAQDSSKDEENIVVMAAHESEDYKYLSDLDYITENNTVNKVSGSNTKEIQVVVSSVDKEKKVSYVPVQLGILNVGDEIQKPNSSNKYKIENVVNSNGIYVVNSGIAEFKIVSLDDSVSNSTHTILDIGKNPNINIYDRIMTDTENVTKEEKVFE